MFEKSPERRVLRVGAGEEGGPPVEGATTKKTLTPEAPWAAPYPPGPAPT